MINKIYNSNSICLCSENKVDYLKKLGANFVIDRKAENKVQMIREYLNLNSKNNKLNAVLDHVGKDEFQNNIDLLGTDSCYISYGTVSGSTIKNLNLRDLLFKRISFIFTTLASRSDDYKTDLINEFKSEILPNLENGDLKLIVHKNLPFSAESMHLAHQILENNENIGKIIINI